MEKSSDSKCDPVQTPKDYMTRTSKKENPEALFVKTKSHDPLSARGIAEILVTFTHRTVLDRQPRAQRSNQDATMNQSDNLDAGRHAKCFMRNMFIPYLNLTLLTKYLLVT